MIEIYLLSCICNLFSKFFGTVLQFSFFFFHICEKNSFVKWKLWTTPESMLQKLFVSDEMKCSHLYSCSNNEHLFLPSVIFYFTIEIRTGYSGYFSIHNIQPWSVGCAFRNIESHRQHWNKKNSDLVSAWTQHIL